MNIQHLIIASLGITSCYLSTAVANSTVPPTPTTTIAAPASKTSTEHTHNSVTSLIAQITNQAIVPMYAKADQQASKLQQVTQTFCQSPSHTGLQTVKRTWSAALSAWQSSEVALFGPGLVQQRDLHIYFRPVKKRVVKKLLAQAPAIETSHIEFAGVGAQGFAALEYLLFDRQVDEKQHLEKFAAPDSKYCQHLVATSKLLQRDLAQINQDWQQHFATAIKTAGTKNNTQFPEQQQVLELMLGKLDQLAESIPNKLRQALAKNAQLAGKDPQRAKLNPYKLEAWRSGHTLANIRANLKGIQQLLEQGGLLAWLEQHKHPALAQQLKAQLKTLNELSFTSQDLFEQLRQQQVSSADQLYSESLKLSQSIKQMAPALGVQLGFNDSDGD